MKPKKLNLGKALHEAIIAEMSSRPFAKGIKVSESAYEILEKLEKRLETIDCDVHEVVDDADEVLMDIACDIPEIRRALKEALGCMGDSVRLDIKGK